MSQILNFAKAAGVCGIVLAVTSLTISCKVLQNNIKLKKQNDEINDTFRKLGMNEKVINDSFG